ncbi:carbohydrate-binding module family 35 protein [Hypholoma sublateritium FD-334 SS-4]|uniref:Alpha-galactosidase n=1 Tax=Hypholoma sublateritium (strain FD-334 SS-4) TaxID=945553 RepID=A0A0D2PUG0_HYPSF|nr:carbohydrate-binding module family 35 protein [Hypholoma sublateritium FD-334 SS-4]
MGWNPYNAFLCNTNETQYRAAAQSLISLGLRDLGYQYVNLDCGWQGKTRNATGGFTWDTSTIPSGIPALASFVHGLGLKFGVYSDGGVFACDFVGGTAHYLGSLGHETSDAATFASWGADYLKYDNCYAVNSTDFVDDNPPISIEAHYVTMRDALAATNRPIVFSICEWGVQDPARWPASDVGNSWRISNDIGPPASWDNLFRIINQLVPITQFAHPGAWNDLDLLEVGNAGLTAAEQQTHFAFWAAAKSPLFISTDLTVPAAQTLAILKNPRIIALNDALGAPISFRRRYTNDHDVWAGPLADGSTVAVVVNWQNASRTLALDLADAGFAAATATDLITGAALGPVRGTLTAPVAAHGALVLQLTAGVPAPAPAFTYYAAAGPGAVLAGGAAPRVVNGSATVVGFVGNGGTLTLTGVDGGAAGGTKLLAVDYINADVVFSDTACSNCRNAFFSVNGGAAVQAQMPLSGQSWDIVFAGYRLALPGFLPGAVNSVQIGNPSAFAPDFLRVGVAA